MRRYYKKGGTARRWNMEERQAERAAQLSNRFGNDRRSLQAFEKYAQFDTNNAMRKERSRMADAKLQDRYARQDANYSNQQQRASQQYRRVNDQSTAFMDKYNALYNPPKEPTRSIQGTQGATLGTQGTQDTTLGTQSQNPNTTMDAASARALMEDRMKPMPKLKRGGKVKPKTKARGKVKAKGRGNGIASRSKTCKMR